MSRCLLGFLRVLLFAPILLFLIYSQDIQPLINIVWRTLKEEWVFQAVYFETWYVTIVYGIILTIPGYMDHVSALDRFKIDKNSHFERWTWGQIAADAIVYMIPLATLDTFMVKAYSGVPEFVIREKRQSWIQQTRALPELAPSVREMLLHLLISFLIYDALFFLIHLTLHKQPLLYKHIHSLHHKHEEGLQSRITNRLTIAERVTLVLSANFSLKILEAHPLTRTVYVPIFVWFLVENHCNYDFAYSLDKIVPFGLMGGSKHHYLHHAKGAQNYEPFFTHLDRLYQALTPKKHQ